MDSDNKKRYDPVKVRLIVFAALFGVVLLTFVCVLYQAQIVNGSEYLAQSVTSNAKTETVSASRGVITDRNGTVLVTNQASYVLRFDASLFETGEQINAAILRLLTLLRQNGVTWTDDLPISASTPFTSTLSGATEDQASDFATYLKGQDLVEGQLTPAQLIAKMRVDFKIADAYTDEEARLIAGVRYGLKLQSIGGSETVVLAENISVELMSQIADGNYVGASTGTSSVRKYETTYAAHILGRIGRIDAEEYKTLSEQGYAMNAMVGKDGVESAFESYLHGEDGTALLTTDATGKVTGEVYAVEPQPGDTVALTIDLNLQQTVEDSLAKRIGAMESADGVKRGGAAVVIGVGSGEVLALASYPTYNLATFYEDYESLLTADPSPMFNRATDGTYAPGSTFKPCTATAALESGTITTSTEIIDRGIYTYYSNPQPTCWIYSSYGSTHGSVDVTKAITVSCNYFFYEVGRLTGIATIDEYARQFGLGEHTGIETGDSAGALASPEYAEANDLEWTDGQTLTAAIGQSYNLFTPIQLANYIATLAGGGDHYAAHLLKSVKTYDNSEVVYSSSDIAPTNTVSISEENLTAILTGMHNLTTGSLSGSFANCVVSAGAKTGTAETGGTTANGVFVAFAPYENPQIAVAVVIEKGGSGAALASVAVDAINAYFSKDEIGTVIIGENELLR